MPENGSLSTTDILNGWKEIAAYLGKSVRSVQRWERDLALPIHRITTADGGQIVYSSRTEIDVWRTGLDAPSARQIDRDRASDAETRAAPTPVRLPVARRAIAWAT